MFKPNKLLNKEHVYRSKNYIRMSVTSVLVIDEIPQQGKASKSNSCRKYFK